MKKLLTLQDQAYLYHLIKTACPGSQVGFLTLSASLYIGAEKISRLSINRKLTCPCISQVFK